MRSHLLLNPLNPLHYHSIFYHPLPSHKFNLLDTRLYLILAHCQAAILTDRSFQTTYPVAKSSTPTVFMQLTEIGLLIIYNSPNPVIRHQYHVQPTIIRDTLSFQGQPLSQKTTFYVYYPANGKYKKSLSVFKCLHLKVSFANRLDAALCSILQIRRRRSNSDANPYETPCAPLTFFDIKWPSNVARSTLHQRPPLRNTGFTIDTPRWMIFEHIFIPLYSLYTLGTYYILWHQHTQYTSIEFTLRLHVFSSAIRLRSPFDWFDTSPTRCFVQLGKETQSSVLRLRVIRYLRSCTTCYIVNQFIQVFDMCWHSTFALTLAQGRRKTKPHLHTQWETLIPLSSHQPSTTLL